MAGERLIDDYIAELRASLTVPRRVARRILAEARDHLDETAARFADEGVPNPASAAIAAFGEPALVARRFAEQLALSAARRANRRGFVLLALLLAVLALWGIGAVRLGGRGAGLMLMLAGQIALVAGTVSLARAHVAARRGALDELRLRYVVRGHTTVAVCGAAVAAALAPSGRAPLAAIALLGAAIAWELAAALSATRRLHPLVQSSAAGTAADALADLPAAGTAADALADLAATATDGVTALAAAAPLLRGPLAAARRLGRAAYAGPLGRATRLWDRIDPARRPWRFALAVALVAGAAVPLGAAAALVYHGNLDPHVRSVPLTLWAATLKASIEAALVLLCYAALGRYLGLRPPHGRATR